MSLLQGNSSYLKTTGTRDIHHLTKKLQGCFIFVFYVHLVSLFENGVLVSSMNPSLEVIGLTLENDGFIPARLKICSFGR